MIPDEILKHWKVGIGISINITGILNVTDDDLLNLIYRVKKDELASLKEKIYGLPSVEGESAGYKIEFISAIELSNLIDESIKEAGDDLTWQATKGVGDESY